MRLADSDLLPYDFTGLADTIHRYHDVLQKLLKTKQDDAVERNKQLEGESLRPSPIPKRTSVPPPAEEVPPHLNFAPLENASDSLTHSAERYQKALEKVTKYGELTVSPKLAGHQLAAHAERTQTHLLRKDFPAVPGSST